MSCLSTSKPKGYLIRFYVVNIRVMTMVAYRNPIVPWSIVSVKTIVRCYGDAIVLKSVLVMQQLFNVCFILSTILVK